MGVGINVERVFVVGLSSDDRIVLLDDQWAGEYWFRDEAVHEMKRKQRSEVAKKNIGVVFQSYHLLDDLTVQENIDLPLSYKDIPRNERQAEFFLASYDIDGVIQLDLPDSEVRRRVLVSFEAAEVETDPARRRALLTFAVIVIGGWWRTGWA